MNHEILRGSNAIRNHVRPRRAPWWLCVAAFVLAVLGVLFLVGWVKGVLEP
jgi:hypothetical protein